LNQSSWSRDISASTGVFSNNTDGNKAKKADSNVAHSLEAKLLLARGARVMLTSNLWTEAKLVNSAIKTV